MSAPRVLIVASEGMPFVKTGGLADVVGALPKALKEAGVDAAVMMPKHSKIRREHQDELETVATTTFHLGWREKYLGIQTMEAGGIPYYFIDNEDYFSGAVYLGGDTENEQYLYFCKAVCEALSLIDFSPDILHLNDWHTGMIPLLVRTQYAERFEKNVRLLFTIHNIQFQGMMGFEVMKDMLNIPDFYNTPEFAEAGGCANMMKAALVFSDKISTVSPGYAHEIMNAYFGLGMEGILSARRHDVVGILNGIDTEEFDPGADPAILGHFTAANLTNKRLCKRALRDEFDLDIRLTTPIIGMVTRLTSQKGLDLVRYALEELLQEDVAFILLGSGDAAYQDFFHYIAAKYPARTGVYIGYDEVLAHRVYAGCDFLLMPSRFEPCGLSQMIAQRYGTLPIVRKTGGLVDTVEPYNKFTGEGTGFSFGTFNAHDMMAAVRLALSVYRDKAALRKLRKNAMLSDNSFKRSAEQYKALYKSMR
ncbi:MAG: glycogen synthase [Clostridiales Family XIII bacterium]|jgi:starch synthase|nr:glycogen synthase [Clostridiales Family XIII bacterium]